MTELNRPVGPQETYRSILQHQISILLRDPGAVFQVEKQLQKAADDYAEDAVNDSRANAKVVGRPRESGPAPVTSEAADSRGALLAQVANVVFERGGSGTEVFEFVRMAHADVFRVKMTRGLYTAEAFVTGQEVKLANREGGAFAKLVERVASELLANPK
jgi:hypothetical protein